MIENSECNLNSAFVADGSSVDFYQIMGSGSGDVFSIDNKHKTNFIGSISVHTVVDSVSMTIDRQNNVECKVVFNTGVENTLKGVSVTGRDIVDENDWAYTFSVI